MNKSEQSQACCSLVFTQFSAYPLQFYQYFAPSFFILAGMSTSTLTNPGSGGLYRSTHSRSSIKSTLLLFGAQRNPICNYSVRNPLSRGQHVSTGQRCVKVEAGWLFKGGGADKGVEASIEFSESANEDILVFFFQLDLATRVQYALNLDQFDIAQQLRNKLTEVEEEVTRQRNTKKGSSAKTEVQDQAIRILRLRAELQSAIDTENYAAAAELRDGIAKLEAESLEASAKALAYGKVQYAFRLGQKLRHKIFGYRGVICGMDPVCCESNDWMQTANVQSLSKGSNQPFYQSFAAILDAIFNMGHQKTFSLLLNANIGVLVDVREDADLLVTYVPEENLIAPEKPDLTRFDHPYTSFLFYGVDSAGDFIPVKQLREKYNQPRYEVPSDPEDEEDGDRP